MRCCRDKHIKINPYEVARLARNLRLLHLSPVHWANKAPAINRGIAVHIGKSTNLLARSVLGFGC
jgi:hypothetical protein